MLIVNSVKITVLPSSTLKPIIKQEEGDQNAKSYFSVLVHNEYGVVTRISGLFTRRGLILPALAGEETEDPRISRITIVAKG